ncbi:MAG TPA: c-type cytochrome [Alphaproteobacteria bacterium]|nr:c-type cytochrome [Alphaproteobacteria bacterium]
MSTHIQFTARGKYAVAAFLACLGLGLWSAPVLGGTAASPRTDPLVGRKLYMTYCYTCHGMTGRGDGPAAAHLAIKPRNLTDDAYMSKRTDQDLYTVISGGSAAIHRFSEMPAWKHFLYHERILDIIAYIRTLHRPGAAPGQPEERPGDAEAGKRLYADYCAVCHGKEGRGDGPVTRMFGPKPFDFTDAAGMAAKSDLALYLAIFGGGEAIGKSAYMPRWTGLLTEQQIWDVIAYVRTFSGR